MTQVKIDTIKMVRSIREKHYEENKGKSHKEIMAAYRKQAANIFKKSAIIER